MTSRPRQDFIDAVGYFTAVVDTVEPDHWDLKVGDRTLVEMAAHGSRPLTTTRDFLRAGATTVDHPDVISYYVGPRPPDPNREEASARRGREALERLEGGDRAETIRGLAADVLQTIAGAGDDALVGTNNGGMHLVDYLPTRSLELLIYGFDIAEAVGASVAVPEGPVESGARLLTEVNLARGRGVGFCRTVWTEVGHS